MTDNAETSPWYVEHSRKPKGAYGAVPFKTAAESNPENRRGVSLHHHSNYAETDVQRSISTGLAILRESPNRVVMVGGDLPNGRQRYYHVRWKPDEHTYELVDEKTYHGRTEHQELGSVLNALDEKFPADSLVCVLLIYQRNSPFNVPENRSTVVIAA